MQDLNVTIIQTALEWQRIDANIDKMDQKIDRIEADTDVIILPEMFSTGFSMEAARLAETMEGKAVTWLRRKAAEVRKDIAGSLMIRENERFFNRLVWAKPDGRLATYDKKHLFAYAGEDKVYSPGHRAITVELKGWRIRPFICYDLRFPIWCRNLDLAYDLAVFVANWPHKRSPHWRALLRARAIENQAYVVGLNRVGEDGNGFAHSGDSAVIDPLGGVLFEKSWEECIHTATLQRRLLEDYRSQFPAWRDADRIKPRQDTGDA